MFFAQIQFARIPAGKIKDLTNTPPLYYNTLGDGMRANCEECLYYEYDDEYEEYLCSAPMDMDEEADLLQNGARECPFYRPGDEYTVVRKQN